MKVAWRFLRRYLLLGCLMSGFFYAAIYFSTNEVFQAQVNLNPVHHRAQQADPVFPWEAEEALAEQAAKPHKQHVVQVKMDKGRPHRKSDTLEQHVVQRAVMAEEGSKEVKKSVAKQRRQNQQESNEDEPHKPVDFMTAQEEIQKERQRTLQETCDRYPVLTNGTPSFYTMRHLLVNEKHKLLYCFVPKVGCSNWKRVLMVLSGLRSGTDDITSNEAHFHNGMKRLIGHSPEEQKVILETYTKFMYARHPFVRILSAYRNKFADYKMYKKETYFHIFSKRIIRKYRKNPTEKQLQTGENITWDEWVQYLTDPQEMKNFDDHWQEIYRMCSPCKIHYDYIGKLETVNDDAKYMLTSLELDDKASFPARANSHPTNSSNTYEKFFGELTINKLKRLWDVYHYDFELFGYPKPGFL